MSDTPIPVRDFWLRSPKEQKALVKQASKLELEAYAEEHELLLYRGKLVKPDDYPCKCELCNAYQCWSDKHPDAPDYMDGHYYCKCKCHTYYED